MRYGLLSEKIRSAIAKSAQGAPQSAVPFSAGLDSSIIAHVLKGRGDVLLITVGVKGSDDVNWAEEHSRNFAGKHIVHILTEQEILAIYKELRDGFGFGFLACDILVSFYKACEIASENGCANVICGAGAEEVFMGYKKYLKEIEDGKKVSEIRKHAISLWNSPQGDGAKLGEIAEKFKMRMKAPFLDDGVISSASAIPEGEHLPKEDNLTKPVLREVALEMGINDEIAKRPKKAMQYGSGVHKILMSLRKKGEI